MSEVTRNYLPVKVVSIDYVPKLAKNDVDRHNKPRERKSLIMAALVEKYSHLVEVIHAPHANSVDLIGLYSIVHDVGMIQFLVDAWSKWEKMGPEWDIDCCQPGWKSSGTPPLIPCHAAFRRDEIERVSTNVMGAFGYYCTDNCTPIVESLARELREDASIVCEAVKLAILKNCVVYAVTTHPGHHCNLDNFGGYCYLNNAALCAKLMQTSLSDASYSNRRVAIIDIDYHCGNGTASIFYRDPDVFFVSIHCDPEIEYPFNAGYADQIGEGDGKGTTLHIPLAPGATWDDYRLVLERAMKAIVEFDVGGLIVSMGLDTYEGDSVSVRKGGFKLSGNDYVELGRTMGSCLKEKFIPTVFIQEGGYKMDVVGDAAADVLGGFSAGAS